jgi:hypothetical protein
MKDKTSFRPLLRSAAISGPPARRTDPDAPRRNDRWERAIPAGRHGEDAWRPCPHCWGQRRILEYREAPNGEGRVAALMPCECCMGIGEVLR